MKTLEHCLKQPYAKTLNEFDVEEIKQKVKLFKDKGVSGHFAEISAIEEYLDEIDADLKDIESQAEEKGWKRPEAPEQKELAGTSAYKDIRKAAEEEVAKLGRGKPGEIVLTDAERVSLILELFDGKKTAAEHGEIAELVLTGGPSGAGKSSTSMTAEKEGKFVKIDSDNIKDLAGHGGTDAFLFHEESSRIAKAALNIATDLGYHTIYDSRMGNFNNSDNMIKDALAKGRNAFVHFTQVDLATSRVRTIVRALVGKARGHGSRLIPNYAILEGMNKSLPTFLALYDKYKDNPNVSFSFYDNGVDGSQPTRIIYDNEITNKELLAKYQEKGYIIGEGGKYELRDKETPENLRDAESEINSRIDRALMGRGYNGLGAQSLRYDSSSEANLEEILKSWEPTGKVVPRELKKTPEEKQRLTPETGRAPPTASEKAKETAQHLRKAIDNFKKINTILLGERGELLSGEKIDSARYEEIKPILKEAWDEMVAAGKSAAEFVKLALESLAPENKPYFEKFVKEEIGNEPVDLGRMGEGEAEAYPGGARGEGARPVPAVEGVEETGVLRPEPGERDVRGLPGGVERNLVRPGEREEREGQPDRTGGRAGNEMVEPVGRDLGNVPSIPNRGTDYIIPEGGLERKGGWKTAAKDNLDAIELYKKILSENRPATKEEQEILVKYVGWGATELANNMFPGYSYHRAVEPKWASEGWQPLVERLVKVMTDDEIKTAARSTQYAHFTSEKVIRSIYKAMDKFGFKGGKILEPGSGIGHFIGLLPESAREKTIYTGIEMDGVSAGIAKLLYPNHNIIEGDYTKELFPRDFFDAALGNPPFGKITILSDPEYKKQRFNLHNYFFAKSLDRVRPGGVLTFVTSHFTMDSKSQKVREYLSESADFIGAIRLPQTAFKKNAGTEVVTDVIFLKKRVKGEAPAGEPWINLAEVDTPEGKALVNEYFANHPEMVLGRHSLKGSMRAANEYTVLPAEGDIEALFDKAVENLPEGVYSTITETPESLTSKLNERDFNPKNKKEGGIYIGDDGNLKIVDMGSGVDIKAHYPTLKPNDIAWLKDYVGLRDALKEAHYDQLTDGPWEDSLKKLEKAYRAFTKKHGKLLQYTTITKKEVDEDGNIQEKDIKRYKYDRLLRKDAEGPLVSALEKVIESGDIVESPALTKRSINKPQPPKIVTVADALAVSLNQRGVLDIAHIAELMNMKEDQVIDSLGTLVFNDPSKGWTLGDDYLSGNVVKKLEEAQKAAKINPAYQRNVEALKEVQPEPLKPEQISVSLGGNWIPTKYYSQFGEEVLGLRECEVTYFPAGNTWTVEGAFRPHGKRSGAFEYGTADRGPNELFEAALNNKIVKITKKDEDTKQTFVDKVATTAANEKMKAIRDKFSSWVWADAERAKKLIDIYNHDKNNIAPRHFDGSHLTLPGVSTLKKLYDHQKRAIWRIIQTGNVYLAHGVGAGKTYEMIGAGMEMKRLGMISKPLYVVPKHMLSSFARYFNEMYPMAHVMVADEKNFHTENRKRFVAQATLNNPDAIVITHPAFGLLSVREETIKPVREKFIRELRYAWQEMQEAGEPQYRIKQMENRIEAAEQQFDSMIAKGDKAVTFEDMGVDYIFVDEAHEFRKLDYVTNQNIKGIDPQGSRKATDLYIKTLWIESNHPNRSHSFASGTPITNTMGELYTIQRFFDSAGMEEDGIDHFDAWSALFARAAVGYEMNSAGRYQPVERFSKFMNIPELMSRIRKFMDVLTLTQLGSRVKLPKIKGGKPQIVITEPIAELKSYQDNVLKQRIEHSMEWTPSPGQKGNPDPLINIITDGRLASIDMRFVDPELPSNPNSKLNKFIDGIIETYNDSKDNQYLDIDGKISKIKGGGILAFYNVGFGQAVAERRGFNARNWTMKRLKEAGVKENDIAWIEDYDTAEKKAGLFRDMRSGNKRILFGSAKKMGTGMNIQTRLSHLHYLDAPWYPSDVEQPMGRIVRQKNQNDEVDIRWYATKGSYDATMWQLVSMKSKFIEKAFLGEKDLRSMEDLSESSQYEMASALASGDERVVELVRQRALIEKFGNLKREYENNKRRFGYEIDEKEANVRNNTRRLELLNRMQKYVPDYVHFESGEIDGKTYDKRDEFNEKLLAKIAKKEGLNEKGDEVLLGKINGFNVYHRVTNKSVDPTTDKMTVWSEVILRFEKDLEERWPAHEFTTQRFVNFLNRIGSDISSFERDNREFRDTIKELKNRLEAPFEYEREYLEAITEASRIEQELAAEGEPAPEVANQASEELEIIEEEAEPETLLRGTSGEWSPYQLSPKQLRNAANATRYVYSFMKMAGAPQEVLDRIRVEAGSFIDLRGKDYQRSLNEWIAAGGKPNEIFGAVTIYDTHAVMQLAMNIMNLDQLETTAYHEWYHIAKRWLMTQKDAKAISRFFPGEEGRKGEAESFAKFAKKLRVEGIPNATGLKRLWMKLRRYLQIIKNGLTGKGWTRPEDIFGKIYLGQYRPHFRAATGETRLEIPAFHGTKQRFQRFKSKKVGTGEGSQSFGWGLYFTSEKEIAKFYASPRYITEYTWNGKKASFDSLKNLGLDGDTLIVARDVILHGKYEAIKRFGSFNRYKDAVKEVSDKMKPYEGEVYKVTLHKGKSPGQYDYLKWDEKLTPEQVEKIKAQWTKEKIPKAWQASPFDATGMTGEQAYRNLANKVGIKKTGENKYYNEYSDKEASLFLLRAGIDGIEYPAGTLSGVKESKARNYVVFDENAITIEPEGGVNESQNIGGGISPIPGDTTSPEFRNFFKKSKVVDEKTGKPLVVYHGTTADPFEAFDKSQLGDAHGHATGLFGFAFTNDPEVAGYFSGEEEPGANIIPAYLSIQRPYEMSSSDFYKHFVDKGGALSLSRETDAEKKVRRVLAGIKAKGYDGIHVYPDSFSHWLQASSGEYESDVWFAFEPTQIKSIFNRGTWSAKQPDIMLRMGEVQDDNLRAYVQNSLNEIKTSKPKQTVQARKVERNVTDGEAVRAAYSERSVPDMMKPYKKADGTYDGRRFYKDTGIVIEGADAKDLNRWIRRLQTKQDQAKNYPEMRRLLDVQTRGQGATNAMSIDDRETTEDYYKLNKKAREKVDEAMFYGDQIQRNLGDKTLKDKFKLTDDEIKGFRALRSFYDKKRDLMGEFWLEHMVTPKEVEAILKKSNQADYKAIVKEAVAAINARNNGMIRESDKEKVQEEFKKKLETLGYDSAQIDKLSGEGGLADHIGKLRGYVPHQWDSEWRVYAETKAGSRYVFDLPDMKIMRHITAKGREAAAKNYAEQIVAKELGTNVQKIRVWQAKNIPMDLFEDVGFAKMQGIVNSAAENIAGEVRQEMGENVSKETLKDVMDKIQSSINEMWLAKGAGRHMIGRSNVFGYKKKDLAQITSSYANGMNAWYNKAIKAREFADVLRDINPRRTPEMWRDATEYVSDMLGESSEAGWFKRLAGLYYLAGDLSAATLNMTQNWTHAVALLRGIKPKEGKVTSEREIARAMKDVMLEFFSKKGQKGMFRGKSKFIEPEALDAMNEAFRQGILDPQLFGEATGFHKNKVYQSYVQDIMQFPFKLFTASEGWNRMSTFLAAYRRATRAGEADPMRIAADLTNNSQFIYGRGNRPEIIRSLGALGNVAYTYMTYPINNLVFLKHRMEDLFKAASPEERRTAMKVIGSNLAYLFAFGGLNALPFFYLVRFVQQLFDDPEDDWEKWLYQESMESEVLPESMKKAFARGLAKGIPAILGNDFSWRVQGTDVIGAPIGLQTAKQIFYQKPATAIKHLQRGEAWHTIFFMLPDMLVNPYKAFFVEGGTGIEGKPPIKYTTGEAVTRALGFSPTRESEVRQAQDIARRKREQRLTRLENFAEKLVQIQKDPQRKGMTELTKDIKNYNTKESAKGPEGLPIKWSDIVKSAKQREKARGKTYEARLPEYMRPFQKEMGKAYGLEK